MIVFSEGTIRAEEIANTLNISVRSVYYSMDRINEWLSYHNIGTIVTKRKLGFALTKEDKTSLKDLLHHSESPKINYYVFSQNERAAVILCSILSDVGNMGIQNFIDYCDVSRNTILADLKIVKNILRSYDLDLIYEIRCGYSSSGSTVKKRSVFMDILSNNMGLLKRKLISFIDYQKIDQYLEKLFEVERLLNTEYVDGSLFQLAVLMSASRYSKNLPELIEDKSLNIANTPEHNAICSVFHELPEEEQLYFTVHLLGTPVVKHQSSNLSKEFKLKLFDMANQLISEFERIACIEFNNRNELLNRMEAYLKVAFYRYHYGISIGNPLTEDIQIKYEELFQLTKRVSVCISQRYGYVINKGEIAYLTLIFGSHMKNSGNRNQFIRTLLICPNNITAHMLKKELEEIVPLIKIVDIVPNKDLSKYEGLFDLIVTTVDIETQYKNIKVSPIMTAIDKKNILSFIVNESYNRTAHFEAERIYKVIKKDIPEDLHEKIFSLVLEHFKQPYENIHNTRNYSLPSLNELITEDNITIVEQANDWRASIEIAAMPLLRKGYISKSYISAMKNGVEKLGPYMFITPKIALVHAKPQEGVNNLSISIMVIRQGVWCPEDMTENIII